jgi:hypothetical protein
LVSHQFSIQDYKQAFGVALQREGFKIMLSPYSEQGGFT